MLDSDLCRRVMRELYEPVARAVLAGDHLSGLREFHEATEPHRLLYRATMRSGLEINFTTDGPFGFAADALEASLREMVAKIAESHPSTTRH